MNYCAKIAKKSLRKALFQEFCVLLPQLNIENMTGIGLIGGAIAGFIAAKLYGGKGKGCIVNLILGLVGGAFGGWLGSAVGIFPVTWLGEMVVSIVGAIIILWLWNKLTH